MEGVGVSVGVDVGYEHAWSWSDTNRLWLWLFMRRALFWSSIRCCCSDAAVAAAIALEARDASAPVHVPSALQEAAVSHAASQNDM